MLFWNFFTRHTVSSLAFVVTASIALAGFIFDAQQLAALPWFGENWPLLGLAGFFLVVVALLARWDANRLKVADQEIVAHQDVHSATLDFTLRGVGDLIRHQEGSKNVEEAFAILAAFEGDSDGQHALRGEALENPRLGKERAWYIAVIFAQPFEAREVRFKDPHPQQEVVCTPNRRSQKFMLVRCKGLKIGTRAKLEITRETGLG